MAKILCDRLFSDKKRMAAYAMLIGAFVIVALFAPHEKEMYSQYSDAVANAGEKVPAALQVNYGAWSLIVPVIMFIFVLLTKSFLEAFVWSSVLTVFIRFRAEVLYAFTMEQINVLTDYDNARMILLYFTMGSVLAAVAKGGGARAFAEWVKVKAKSSKLALVLMWVIDCALSIDDELSAFTCGAAMTPIVDSYGIPREKSAFMIRSSAVASATIWPLGAWVVFVSVLLEQCGFAASGKGVSAYMQCVPFLFFPFAILLIGLLTALGIFPDIGTMKKATERVKNGGPIAPAESGKEMGDDASVSSDEFDNGLKPRMINFFIPVIALVAGAVFSGLDVMVGIITALVVTFILYIVQGICTPKQFINDILLGGMNDMMMLTALFGVSLVLVKELSAMGFAPYIVSITAHVLSPKILPFVVFTVFACTEFLVSFNWSLYMMALPVVVPLAQATGANPYMVIAALICAGIWGSQGCLYSDGALVAAAATGTDVYEASTASVPYMTIAAGLTAIGFLIAGFIF